MNKIRIILLAFCFIVFGNVISMAQGVMEQMKKVRKAYVENKQFLFDVEAYSFSSKTDVTPDLISKGCVKKDNDKYYSSFDGLELLINGKRALLVNTKSKSMLVAEERKKKNVTPLKDIAAELDKLITTDSVVERETKNDERHFTAYSKTGFIKQTELYVDTKTWFVKRVLYQYFPPTEEYQMEMDRVEIFYRNIQIAPTEEAFFSFDKYFKSSKNKLTPVGKYQGYKIKSI